VYRHASSTWDELSPEERERAMGFQTGTISHTKVIRLERNTLLGKGMNLNSLTWLLVTCLFFQIYITLTLVQLACSFGNVTTWHLDQVHLLSSTLYISFLVLGGKRYHVI
jgi:hypothetical protein